MKEGRLEGVDVVAEYDSPKWDQIYKVKLNQKSAVSLLCKFKTPLFEDKAIHSLGMFTSSMLKKEPLLFGFQTEFDL